LGFNVVDRPVTNRLIIFTRYPEAGKAKTRLISALGAEGAAELHREMAEHTVAQARKLQSYCSAIIEVRFSEGDSIRMQEWLGDDLFYQSQGAGDLGDRLIHAAQFAFNHHSTSIVIIGTDCPELDAVILQKAFDELREHDLVLGPANDGGYYLIGLRRFIPEPFQGIAWSTSQVLQQTVEIATQLRLAIAYLPLLSDVDYPQDLVVWERVKKEIEKMGK
jgi:rSAM/selenodomain-associated transferase 1